MAQEFEFDANDSSVKDLLFTSPSVQMRVPRYQRPYSWEEDQVADFWLDLTGNSNSFLIGSIILNYEDQKKNGWIEIIDGQQRLLTITIFIAVLRDLMLPLDEDISRRFQTQCISVEGWDGKETLRIHCADSIREFFEKYVQSSSNDIQTAATTSNEERRVKNNYLFFYDRVSSALSGIDSAEEKIKYLEDLRNRVAALVVIHIQIFKEEDAYEIFESTNARGVDLNVGDLLKNLIFKNLLPSGQKDEAKNNWEEIIANVEPTGFEIKRFLRYFWISKYSFVQEKNLFKAVKSTVSDWSKLLSDLVEDSRLFWLLLGGSKDEWEEKFPGEGGKYFRAITALRFMGVTQCFVFLLSLLRNISTIGASPLRVIEFIEKFTFTYSAIAKSPGNRLEDIYSKYACELENLVRKTKKEQIQGKANSLFDRLMNELKEERPTYEVFAEKWMEIRYKQSSTARVFIKYILDRINLHFEPTREKVIDFEVVNIEHFIPQNPSSGWKFRKEEIKDFVNLLGNLTLVDKKINSSIGNKDAKSKLNELAGSQLAITIAFIKEIQANKSNWEQKDVLRRQKELGELAYNVIWAI